MKKIILPGLMLMLLATSCSSGKKSLDLSSDKEVVVENSSEFIVESSEDDLFLKDDSDTNEEKIEIASEKEVMLEEDFSGNNEDSSTLTGKRCFTGSYKVKGGETLMQIAFNLYGDYTKWNEIAEMNNTLNGNALRKGMMLSYCRGSELSWKPLGNPHVIRLGETLGSISNDKYGTIKRWKDIWNNNKPLIRNPNKIFAGFTIYYIPRKIATL